MILKLPALFFIAYISVNLLQFLASIDGIMHFLGLHWIFAGFAALILIFVPAVGPLAGVYGAVAAWHWPPLLAVILFFWPYLIYLFLFLFGTTASFVVYKKMFRPFRYRGFSKSRPQDIEPDFTVKETNGVNPEESTPQIEHLRKE